jgi:hypothetical protein
MGIMAFDEVAVITPIRSFAALTGSESKILDR